MELKDRYKLTELGAIPVDWVVSELENIVDKDRPITYGIVQTGNLVYNGVRCVRVIDLKNGRIESENLITTSQQISNSYKRTILKKGDLVIALRGKIGEVANVEEELVGSNLTRGVALIAVRSGILKIFLQYQLRSEQSLKILESRLNGSALKEISLSVLKKIPVALPTNLTEQIAIANALCDADALINRLEKLIAKKKSIKQGALQELLKNRNTWQSVLFHNLLELPITYGVVTAGKFQKSGIPMVRGGDIKNGRVNTYDIPLISKEKSNEYSRTVLKKDDLIIALVGYPGEVAKINDNLIGANISRAVGLIRLKKFVHPDFIVHLLNSPAGRKIVLTPSAGSAQVVVNLVEINKLKFSTPNITEQKRISEILSTMDEEILILQKKLRKYKQIKQGMMQNLLTGKIRLIKNEEYALPA